MATAHTTARNLMAPEHLGLDTRHEFREAAIAELNRLPEGEGSLRIDLSRTVRVDSAGLSALMLIHRHAADRRLRVVLHRVGDELRFLLALTRMDDLFVIEPETP